MMRPVRLLVRYGQFDGERPPRRRAPLLVEVLPWWAFLALGAAAYALVRWGSPYFVPKGTFSAGIVAGFQASALIAWHCGVIFAAIAALVAFITERFPAARQ